MDGVLLCNLGTPDAPTPSAVRRYLAEFLWDPRVVEIPRPLWWLILHGVVLRTRPSEVAHKYRQIWGDDGAPLRAIGERQALALQQAFDAERRGAASSRGARRRVCSMACAAHVGNTNGHERGRLLARCRA